MLLEKIYDCVSWMEAVYGLRGLVLISLGTAVLVAVIAYFLGCFNGAVIVSKYILHNDVRNHGSGNAGMTNFHRVFGGPLTLLVILTDVLKAVLAVLVGMWLLGFVIGHGAPYMITLGKYWAGTFCMLGHMFPYTFGFRGGKGILSGGTIAIMIDWRLALILWGGFLVLAILTRWVSLGSSFAGAAFPFVTWFVFRDIWCTILAAVCGVLIVWKHRGNIKRILNGTESKFSLHRKKEEEK